MAKTLIRNGRIVTAVDDYTADILVVDGRIETIGRNLAVADAEVHDAAGLLVLPGGVDVHTHLDWEFGPTYTVDTFGTGTKSAAFGGTTTLIDFCNQTAGAESAEGPGGLAQAPRERLRRRRRAHDHARREPAQPGRHEDADRQGGRDQLQAVHGLSRRADGRRRCAVQGDARRRRQRCDDLHPRRERAGDPGAGAGSGGAGAACAQVPRDDPSVDS